MDNKNYTKKVLEAIIRPDGSKQSGSLAAPFTDNNVSIFSQVGSGSKVLTSTTTSVVVMYDPELALRRGQNSVVIYERNAANTVVAASKINVGRNSKDFNTAGVISSQISVENTSGADAISGIQSQGLVYTQPVKPSTLTSTTLSDLILEKDKDFIGGVSSKETGTSTLAVTDHFGSKMAPMGDFVMGNLLTRRFVGSDATNNSVTATGIAGTLSLAANTATTFVNSSNFDVSGSNPDALKEDTARFSVKVSITSTFTDTTGSVDNNSFSLQLRAFDAQGTLRSAISLNESKLITQTSADNVYNVGGKFLSLEPNSNSPPISSFQVMATSEHALVFSSVIVELEALTPLSDITNRPVHYAVLEGVNAGGTISVRASACISGVPDSTNAFISNISRDDSDEINYSDVDELLRQTTRGMQHAFEGLGKQDADQMLEMILSSKAFESELQAFSFRKIGRTLKKVYKGAKHARKIASAIAREAQPIMQEGGMLLQMTGDPRLAAVGTGLVGASDAMAIAQREGILEK